MGFRSSILAGVKLIREAIQSPNYVAGTSGWSINRDGTAEFGDMTIRSSDGSGSTVVIQNGMAEFAAANGWKIIIDPTDPLAPVIYFTDANDRVVGAMNVAGDLNRAALYIKSGELSDGVVNDWKWIH